MRENRNDSFYNQHIKNEYEWKEYVDFKKQETAKTAKLVGRKEQNLKDQKRTTAEYGAALNDAERNILKAYKAPGQKIARRDQQVEVVGVNHKLAKKNTLAAYEQIVEQQQAREEHIKSKMGEYLQ